MTLTLSTKGIVGHSTRWNILASGGSVVMNEFNGRGTRMANGAEIAVGNGTWRRWHV